VASNFSRIPGMLFVNRPLAAEEPDIRDLGVTTLAYVDVKPPEDFEGRNLV